MIHYIEPDAHNLHGDFSRERSPILTLDTGDTIIARTRCAGWGLQPPATPFTLPPVIKRAERVTPEHDGGICLVGPIAVRGAQPGQVLAVAIEELELGAYGITVAGGGESAWQQSLGVDTAFAWMMWQFDPARGTAVNQHGYTVSTAPFLGCLGVALADSGYHTNLTPRHVGGNIDCKELVAGSTLYLPIAVPDALFSFGDGHAAQGDGEVGGSAIECPMQNVKLTFSLRDDLPITWPVAHTPAGWITFGFHAELHEAKRLAMYNMLDLMERTLGCSRKEALMLSSLTVDLHITQCVNPAVGVHAIWRDRPCAAKETND